MATVRRLSDPASFTRLHTARARARAGALWLAFVPADDPSAAVRVAYAIGKRVGGAVVRNRLRRRLRAVFAELAETDLAPGDYLVGAAPEAAVLTLPELSAQVRRLLKAVHPSATAAP